MRRYGLLAVVVFVAGCVVPPRTPVDPSMKVGPDTYLIEVSSYGVDAKVRAIAAANKKCSSLRQEILVLDVKDIGDPKKMPQMVEVMFRCLPQGSAQLNEEPLQRAHARDVVPGKTVIAPNITNNSSGR